MKLAHPDINRVFDLNGDAIPVLVIERPEEYTKLLLELMEQVAGLDGKFVLSKNSQIFDIRRNVEIVESIFAVELNQRNLVSKLYSAVEEKIHQGEADKHYNKMREELLLFLANLELDIEAEIEFEHEINISQLLKSVQLRFNDDFHSMPEKILNYTLLVRELLGDRVFVFINLKTFLGAEELRLLYNEFSARKIKVFLFEHTVGAKLPNEEITIIDDELCEIEASD